MGSSIAARRAAKANRRKAVVAQKRAAELAAGGLAGRASRAAAAPFHECLLNSELFTGGIGTLVFVRGTATTGFSVASFLIDAWCLGVKNAYFHMPGPMESPGQIKLRIDRLRSRLGEGGFDFAVAA